MRYLIVMALIVLAQQPTKPPESSRTSESTSSQISKQSNSTQRNDTPPVNRLSPATQTTNREENTAPTDENVNIQRKLVLFTGLLVVAAFVTAGVIFWQSWETRKAAEAAASSVKLQSVQWVALKDWRSSLPSLDRLKVEVDVFNETNYPLTIRDVVFRIGTAQFTSVLQLTIVPKAHHTVNFSRSLTPGEEGDYVTSCIVFGIRGAITFTGVAGTVVQWFGGLIAASQSGGTTFRPESAYEQSAQEHYGENPRN